MGSGGLFQCLHSVTGGGGGVVATIKATEATATVKVLSPAYIACNSLDFPNSYYHAIDNELEQQVPR